MILKKLDGGRAVNIGTQSLTFYYRENQGSEKRNGCPMKTGHTWWGVRHKTASARSMAEGCAKKQWERTRGDPGDVTTCQRASEPPRGLPHLLPLRLGAAPLLDTRENMGISQWAFTLFYNYL